MSEAERIAALERDKAQLTERLLSLHEALLGPDWTPPAALQLTRNEALLFRLMLRRGLLRPRQAAEALAAGRGAPPRERSLYTAVGRLRRKLRAAGADMLTQRGVGWRLDSATIARFGDGA